MNLTRLLLLGIGLAVLLSFLLAGAFPGKAAPPAAETAAAERRSSSRLVRMRLVAREAPQDLDGDGSLERLWTFNGRTPGPEIRARVGDRVSVRFKNRLPVPSSIHWHGIELNNRSDGSQVTQNEVPPGGSYRYRFTVTRPGVFWYHPHIKPSNQVFKGLYGPLIVTDDGEAELTRLGALPEQEQVVMLSDVTVCKEPGRNDATTFPADGSLPWSGPGPFPGNGVEPTPRDLCETPLDERGLRTSEPLRAGSIPNVLPSRDCLNTCRVNMGQWVLTNGAVAAARSGSPGAPGSLAPGARPLEVRSGQGLRLRLINAAIFRYFRLVLTDAAGRRQTMYRVGGEGGLLNRARTEGGRRQGYETGFERGEILLAPGDRADLVVVPRGAPGDVLTLWTQAYEHTGQGLPLVPTVPVLHLEIAGRVPAGREFKIGPKTRLLTHRRIGRPLERWGRLPTTGALVDPRELGERVPGSADHTIRMTAPGPSIDGVSGMFDEVAAGDYRDIPHIASSRFARLGDLLELRVSNETGAHHVFHQHGFSFQPLRFEDSLGRTRFVFRSPEFVDTVNIPANQALVFRIRLADRAMASGAPVGGGLGRWLFHCHILHHAALGMISELVVLPPER